jgi:uncharacterized membrane protein YqgA involved in biofilm formation
LLTLYVYNYQWTIGPYWVLLIFLGTVSLLLAIRIIKYEKIQRLPLILVIIGLVIGQWWFIELLFAKFIWTIKGFAP